MDKFKQYLEEHRDEMDTDTPSAALPERIEKKLVHPKRSTRLMFIRSLSAAAALAAIVMLGIKLSEKKQTIVTPGTEVAATPVIKPLISDTVQRTAPAKEEVLIVKAAPKKQTPSKKDIRYKMMESFKENYSQLVSYQLSSIRSTPVFAEDPSYFNDFKIRLQQMDADEKNIRRTIRRQGMSNVLLEQLINVYQQKLDVLKSLQAEINKMNERVTEKAPADSSNIFYLHI